MEIRPGTEADLPAIVVIYNHYVLHTPITFDVQQHDTETRTPWFRQFAYGGPHQLYVADDAGVIVGYACSGPFHARAAYGSSVEISIYLAPEHQGRGVAHALYGRLFDALAEEPVHRAYAGVTRPNPRSERLHRRWGFELAASYDEVGYKFGRFWSVDWYQKRLG